MDYTRLSLPDQWCLNQLALVSAAVQEGYERFRFTDALW